MNGSKKQDIYTVPAEAMDFWLLVEIVAIITDTLQPGKYAGIVDSSAPEVNIAALVDAQLGQLLNGRFWMQVGQHLMTSGSRTRSLMKGAVK